MKTSRLTLEEIADWQNLCVAAWRASRGKRSRPEVAAFFERFERNISELGEDIRNGRLSLGMARRFLIRDPKVRLITAPCFRERVLHHAVMGPVAPVLQRAMVDDTFACIPERGTLKAVNRAQSHGRRFLWFVKMDIRRYFPSIDHVRLNAALRRRFRNPGIHQLFQQIIDAYPDQPGRGLPIGALTSQWFANYYLDPLDRFLLSDGRVRGIVRYMDDFAFWTNDSRAATDLVPRIREFLRDALGLAAHDDAPVQRSSQGISMCGYRVYPGIVRIAASRRRRFRKSLSDWEDRWRAREIDGLKLQRVADSIYGMTTGAATRSWFDRIRVDERRLDDEV